MASRTKKASKKLRPFPGGMTLCYIGDGKGKTTAAVGLATRARGYGWSVLYFQFFKSKEWPSGERTSLQKLGVRVEVHGKGFVGILGDSKPKSEHRQAARRALKKSEKLISSGAFKLVVLDESISCIEEGLFSQTELVSLLKRVRKNPKSQHVHIALTGHKKYPKILTQCDLVTKMNMVRHPYYKGYLALKGIDF